jgi:hypothetical protein
MHGAYNETSSFWRCFKKGTFFSGIRGLLHTTAVKIPASVFRLPHGPRLWRTEGAHVQVY